MRTSIYYGRRLLALLRAILAGFLKVYRATAPMYIVEVTMSSAGGCGGWCGMCYANVKGRSNYPGHKGFRKGASERERLRMAFVKRRGPATAAAEAKWSDSPDAWVSQYPFLASFLSLATYEDGGARKTGTLLIFVDQGLLKACLNDREVSEVAFLSASTVEALFCSLEDGLREGGLDWRKGFQQGKRRK